MGRAAGLRVRGLLAEASGDVIEEEEGWLKKRRAGPNRAVCIVSWASSDGGG